MDSDKFFDRQLVTTEDGSSSIFLAQLNEHYHSTHGAIQESQHVFMKMGWVSAILGKSEISILEIGFGTGLNAWLVLQETKQNDSSPKVYYTTLEAFPIDNELASKLNYASIQETSTFMLLHSAPWNEPTLIHDRYTLDKRHIEMEAFVPARAYNLIFFDAFAPNIQPELWTKEVFDKMYSSLDTGGVLVTYCAKGQVRRNMIAAGFTVERLPGPPGKREMLRATKH